MTFSYLKVSVFTSQAIFISHKSLITFRVGSRITDDPYHYLYYGKLPRPRSYFSLELEQPEVGRVVRFDSMSEILSPGMRLGFTSGPTPFLNAMDKHVCLFELGLTLAVRTDKAPQSDSDVQHACPSVDASHRTRCTRVMGLR